MKALLILAGLAVMAPSSALAGFASATSEIKVIINAKADPGVGVKWISLPVKSTDPCCYGAHEESGGGESGLGNDGAYTVNIFSTAYVQSPPNGLSRHATVVTPGLMATFTNPTSAIALVTLDLFGEIALEAAAFEGTALASGRYVIRGGAGEDLFHFADSFAVINPAFATKPQSLTREIRIAPNDSYQLFLDAAATKAVGAVPEPSQWALLILGFGLTGAIMRKHHLSMRPLHHPDPRSNGHGVGRPSEAAPALQHRAFAWLGRVQGWSGPGHSGRRGKVRAGGGHRPSPGC